MPQLPAIELGGLPWRFSWCDASIWAAVQALLADESEAGLAPLAQAMLFDPGLVAWCACAAQQQSRATPWNPAALARLFCAEIVRRWPSSTTEPATGSSAVASPVVSELPCAQPALAAAAMIRNAWQQSRAPCEETASTGHPDVAGSVGIDRYLQCLATQALLAVHPDQRPFIEEAWPELRTPEASAATDSCDSSEDGSQFLTGLSNRALQHWQFCLPQASEVLSSLIARAKRAAEDSEEMARRIEAARLEGLAEFAAGAGHEMNNPLAVISGRAQLLLRTETHPERRRDLAVIHAQALRVHEMIADAMLFARPPEPRRQPVDIGELLTRIVTDLRPAAAERGIALGFQPPAQPCTVHVDPAQVTVAVRAVLDNAMQAIGRQGHIVVELNVTADEVLVIFSDDGPGIPAVVRPYVFDPFFSGRSAGRGLGLGLSKAWRIITQHGGQIHIAAADPHSSIGTRVTLRLRRGNE